LLLLYGCFLTPNSEAQSELVTYGGLESSVDTNAIIFTVQDLSQYLEQRALLGLPTFTVTRECRTEGEATVDGSVTVDRDAQSISYQANATLTDCNGWDGTLSLEGLALLITPGVSTTTDVNGALAGETCIRQLRYQIMVDLTFDGFVQVKPPVSSQLLSGSLTVSCGIMPLIDCSWSQVDVRDLAALKAGCQT
jgi:hypothetical protein